ncbi:MAG: DUF1844 domain-containing protein [Deltaproteobacteria bacterium]|nr:DUF1844 domain-containing protein [Deltaproteobacteria bacterium]
MAAEGEKEEGRGFKVEDRRRFSPDTGEPRETAESTEASQNPIEESGKQESGKAEGSERVRPTDESLAEISFSTFIISLSTQALLHLGEIPNPLDSKAEKDFTAAKQMIDIVAMLREKTRGNLDSGETRLIDEILYDLRMRYVEAVKKGRRT